ncbi:MAG: glycosyl hydrolase 108 family protein [Thiomicrorhabdus sp.]|nr:glycosyl hydrolase 108 family protein [Thiomicrorhabdus sp.]
MNGETKYPEAFERAFEFILKWEGGYVNDPDDSGGETKFGVSKRAHPHLDIKNLTEDQAKEVYYRDYWMKLEFRNLPDRCKAYAFDTAVNMGVDFAKFLCLFADSKMINERIKRYNKIAARGNNIKFLRGWINRATDAADTFLFGK